MDNSIVPLGGFDGYHIGYTHVDEITNTGGFTSYVFEGHTPYEADGVFPILPAQYDARAGRITSSEVSGDDNTIHSIQTTNPYNDPYVESQGQFLKVTRVSGILYTGRYYKNRTSLYRVGSQTSVVDGVSTTTTFEYHPTNAHFAPTAQEIQNSNGKTYRTEYLYPVDFTGAVYDEMEDRNLLTPIETKTIVDGTLQVDGNRTVCELFGPDPYPRHYQRYEMTWDAAGNPLPGSWVTRATVNSYSSSYPTSLTQLGWEPETLTWTSFGRISSRAYEDHVWSYDYHPNTKLLKRITDIDGQHADFDYDGLFRLKISSSREGNVATAYNYNFQNQDPTRPQNHVESIITFTPVTGSELTNRTTLQYLDGLGRSIQTVEQAYSQTENDVIKAIAYDDAGRAIRQYEPFASSGTNGDYVETLPNNAEFTLISYENHPLSRQTSVTPPEWHETKTEYGTNASAITIGNTTYEPNSLMTTSVLDPNDPSGQLRDVEFKDKLGRVVMTRRTDGGSYNDTKYIFDDKNRAVTIIPPGATISDLGLIYQYVYDERDRIIRKKIPDQDWMEYAYDDRDLPTYSQDGNQRIENKWIHTQYDDYGRAIKSGFVNNTGTPNGNAETSIANTDVLTESRYDEGATANSPINYGKLTFSSVRVLDRADEFINTSYGYDPFGRVQHELVSTILDQSMTYGYAKYEHIHQYDFADNLLSANNRYFLSPNGNTPDFQYTYHYGFDHSGRQVNHAVEGDQVVNQLTY
ncbi:MAG: DUF6443 domain-containing protein, partial [Bacteroidota bacterium]